MRSLSILLVALYLLAPLRALALPVGPGDARSLPSSVERHDSLADIRIRGVALSKKTPEDPVNPAQEGRGDCSNPSATLRRTTTGARCAAHELGGIGFRLQNGAGGCLDPEQMRNVQETGTCWVSRPLPHKGYERPANKPGGPRPPARSAPGHQRKGNAGRGGGQPQKPALRVNTNV
ncbi:hypothetical protein LshimejAT787_0500780 [Lyophyllum shimeji]|uniref:Uncharacterized protein n=1 Tax=Lyophyllum shimeji TaxID=47721 RepID=A0A9P3UM16_LYOSH|nr:hypothetical protein LshimejAT787_0500780 [Lyophyllum shimeji]